MLFFEYPMEDWISREVVKKYLSNKLALSMGSVKVALLLMMGLG